MTPLLLNPVAKDYLWGGTRLKEEYNKITDLEIVAETWECSVHPDGLSVIASGEFEGMTLRRILEDNPEYLGNKYSHLKELPIMIKFIDAAHDLSVQVHPDDEYALKYEGQNGKTEMWYIVDATADAKLIYGLKEGVSKEDFNQAVRMGKIQDCLNQISIQKGESYLIPAGTVHAIGAGTLIAEIQENSNVTYRIYDYDRVDKNGQKRELHLDKAMEVMSFDSSLPIEKTLKSNLYNGYSVEELCCCKYFTVNKINTETNTLIDVDSSSFQVLLCIEGTGKVCYQNSSMDFARGQCVFLPAGIGECKVEGKIEFLNIVC